MEEVFKTIPNYEDYEISNCGRVKTKKRKIRYTHAITKEEHFRESTERFMKIYFNDLTGYKHVILYKEKKSKTFPIHKLVAITFLGDPNGLVVNHIDGNKHNNRIDNLEYCTDQYNHEHATKTGLKASGSQIANSKLNENCVHAIKYFLKKGYSHSELSRAFNISRAAIALINKGETWKNIALTGHELELNKK